MRDGNLLDDFSTSTVAILQPRLGGKMTGNGKIEINNRLSVLITMCSLTLLHGIKILAAIV